MEIIIGSTLFFLLSSLSYMDLKVGLLPNVLTYSGMILGIGFSFGTGHGIDALIGIVAGYGSFWIIAKAFFLVSGKEGMGHGDFKLMAMLGAFMGWQAIPFVALIASAVGTLVVSCLLIGSRKDIQTEVAFGPYLAVAGMAWFVCGKQLSAILF